MSNPKGLTLPNALSMFFVMLAAYCIDIFLFKSDLTVLGDAFFARFISFVIVFLYLLAAKEPIETLGISKKKQKFVGGALYGTFFSLVPLAIVTLCEVAYYASTDATALTLQFETPNMTYVRSEENLTPVAGVAIYIFTCFFGNAFKEVFFRGFLLKKFNKITDFGKANFMQAVLYMTFILPYLARNIPDQLSRDRLTVPMAVFMVIFYIVHETFAGIKWGLMTRVSGSTYMAVVDHFLYVFLSNSIFITNRYESWSFMLHMMAIQVVSFLFVLIHYLIGMKKINEKNRLKEAKIEAELKEIEERKKKREAERSVKKKIEKLEEISPAKYKNIVHEAGKRERMAEDDESALENKITLEQALKEEVVNTDDETVDAIIRKANREMRLKENSVSSSDITDDFDSDEFLKAYQRQDGSHRNTGGHRHHHHRHHHREEGKEKETPVVLPVKKETMAKKPKKTITQKMQSLGGIDDSSSNDLI